jgi:hypothetical protein
VNINGNLYADGSEMWEVDIHNTNTDALDVVNKRVIFIDTSSIDITIGGLSGGFNGQSIMLLKPDGANTLTIEHWESSGTQKIVTPGGTDIILTDNGGVELMFYGGEWVVVDYGSNVFIGNVTADYFIGDYFIGDGSLLTGMEIVSAKAKIYINEGPEYITNIGSIGVFVPVNGSWTSGILEGFTMTSDGNITYSGSDSITVYADAKITVIAGGADQAIALSLKKNGALLSTSFGEAQISSTDSVSIYAKDMITLNNGDMLKLYIANTDSTNDITLHNSNIMIFEI